MARKQRFEQWANVHQLKGGKLVYRHPLVGQKTLPPDIDSVEFAEVYERLRLLVDAPAEKKVEKKPPTFSDAFVAWKRSDEWKAFDPQTTLGHRRFTEIFLNARMVPNSTATFSGAAVTTSEAELLPLLRAHLKSLGPHKAKRVGIAIRKLFKAAINAFPECAAIRNLGLDLERPRLPKATPQKRWPDHVCQAYEKRHALGSPARTAYALARYGCGRRGDIARIAWDQVRTKRYIDENDEIQVATLIEFETQKNKGNGGNVKIVLVVRPELEEALNALDRSRGGSILKTTFGTAFSEKSLTNQMAIWTAQAGFEGEGFSLHGLRRTFASEIAEGASNGQTDVFALQKALGHKNLTTTTIYLNELEAEPMAFRAAEAGTRRSAQVRRLRAVE
ncbi:site-specific integrase [Rhizobium sp. BK399]|uniref:site-specific integrase n=1 Tax=Rhizobium sp. BK399 TaxID=2587063 RepID=UPI00160FD6AC|nr:site-specific integrase [Rhizobium sp. BK399]MBB3540789.1 integrase [Rhizobium sp. BK399]